MYFKTVPRHSTSSDSHADAATSAPFGSRPLNIIVADDVMEIQQLLRQWLEEAGHHVFCASSGNEVIAILRKHRADLIITDVIMPDGDGLEVMQELKKMALNPRVLAISGGGTYLRPSDCLSFAKGLGAHAVLLKPFNRDQLFAAAQAALADLPTRS